MGELVVLETGGELPAGVAVIRLARPPMNALNSQMQRELTDVAAQVSTDDATRAVVIYGSDRVFAAGADVKEFSTMSHAEMVRDAERLSDSLGIMSKVPNPVIAAVTG